MLRSLVGSEMCIRDSYRGSDSRSVTATHREAPSSGSSGNLGRGPWGERHPSSVGPALSSEGHYAETVVVDFQDGSGQYGASKIDKTLARSTATTSFHTGARGKRSVGISHTGACSEPSVAPHSIRFRRHNIFTGWVTCYYRTACMPVSYTHLTLPTKRIV